MDAACVPVPVHLEFGNTFASLKILRTCVGYFHAGEGSPLRYFRTMQPTKLGPMPVAAPLTGEDKADSISKFA